MKFHAAARQTIGTGFCHLCDADTTFGFLNEIWIVGVFASATLQRTSGIIGECLLEQALVVSWTCSSLNIFLKWKLQQQVYID